MRSFARLGVVGVLTVAVLGMLIRRTDRVPAADKNKPDAAAVERARETAKMLDDLYKNAVVSMTNNYVAEQSSTPAATVAKEVFAAMHKKGWHYARLVDATGRPKNKENIAQTDFEKKAVEAIKGGKAYVEETGEKDGKPVLRVGTVVPVVMKQCAACHGKKEGVLGAIIYEIPVK